MGRGGIRRSRGSWQASFHRGEFGGGDRYRQWHGCRLLDMGEALLQQRRQLVGRRKPSCGVFGVQLRDDRDEPIGISGLISRIGRGSVSVMRRRMP